MRTTLRRPLAAVLLAPAAAGALAVSGCDGGGSEEDVRQLLDRAFSREVKSADLELQAQLQVEGSRALDRPVRIRASGPYRSAEGRLPAVDLDFRINAGGGGQTVETGFVSTGERSFVKFQGVYYEQPRSEVERTNRLLARNRNRKSSLKALGLNPRSWLRDAKEEGDEEVAGVETVHLSGRLDVEKLVRDFNGFLRRSGGTIAGAAGPVPEPLSASDMKKITEVVRDPTFDIYVGKKDNLVRRISGRLELEVPKGDRAAVGGIEGGALEFSLELSKVNGDQKVEAPAKARPLSDLTRSLGTGTVRGRARRAPKPPPATSAPDADAFKRYAECLDRANAKDTRALQRCAELLQ